MPNQAIARSLTQRHAKRPRVPTVPSLDLDHYALLTGGLLVDSAALLQGRVFYDNGRAGSRRRCNVNGSCDDAPPRHAADISCRTRLIDAGVADA